METSDSLGAVGGRAAPLALVRSGLALADVFAVPLIAAAFVVVLGTAVASLGIAAGGVNFILGLRYLDFFPTFPAIARTLSGLTLLAFSAVMGASTLLLWRFFREGWRRFWSWHRGAWRGTFVLPEASRTAGTGRDAGRSTSSIRLLALIFLGLTAVSFALMMAMAGGPFWHAWRWFV